MRQFEEMRRGKNAEEEDELDEENDEEDQGNFENPHELRSSYFYNPAEYAMDPTENSQILGHSIDSALGENSEAIHITYSNSNSLPYEFYNSALPITDQKIQPAMEKWQMFNILWIYESGGRNKKKELLTDEDIKGRKHIRPLKMTENYYPSIKGYLELLPEKYRKDRHVRTIALLIERYWFNVPLETKQQMLNYVCSLLLPHEDCTRGLT